MRRIVLCAMLAPVLLFVIQAVTAALILPPIPMPDGGLGFVAASTLINAWVLLALAMNLHAPGWRRPAILFLVAAGIPANNLLEAVFFPLDLPRSLLLPLFASTATSAALFSVALHWMSAAPAPSHATPPLARRAAPLLPRLVVCDVLYIALYFAAGIAVWPFISHFYEGRPLPEPHHIMLMQVFRGLVFSGILYALVRFLAAPRAGASVLIAATLALLGGVAPLLVPNPYMPASIRYPHMVEVGVSNFIFGLVAARLLRPAVAAVVSPRHEPA
jgi:hypothetical protein